MSELFKPLTGSPLIASVAAATPAGAVATASAALGSLPPALADITAGTVIAGVVVERGRGMVVLKTDKGMLPLQTNLPLKLGAAVVLEVQSVGAQVRLAIISVDQHAPAASLRDAPTPETPPLPEAPEHGEAAATATTPTPKATPANRNPAPSLVGRTVTATVVGPPDPRAAASTSDATIPTLLRRLIAISTVVRVAAQTQTAIAEEATAAAASTIPPQPRGERSQAAPVPTTGPALQPADVGVELPAIPTAEELEAALKTLPAPARDIVAALLGDDVFELPTQTAETNESLASPASPDRAALARAPSTESLPMAATPKTIAIRILAQAPATDGPLPPPRAQAPARNDTIVLVGTVVSDDGRETEIATPIGRLRLPLPAPLPQGTRITFEVIARADTQGPAQPQRAADTLAQMVEAERDWSAVRDVATRWPEAADALLPKAGQSLGPAVLAFLAAVRGGGNLKPWAGPRFAEAEAPTKKELIARLAQDMATQARTATSPHPDGWQTIAVPVIESGRVSELRFRFRKRERNEGDSGDEGRRFVVEAKLSALGPLQLDGTVRERHLDLVVRTAKALPPAIRRDIADVFARSLAETSYRGEIRFRNDASGELMPGASVHGPGVVV